MERIEVPKLKGAHGVGIAAGSAHAWNGVTVEAVTLRCEPGEVWHDISHPQDALNVMLAQLGGRTEPRTRRDRPCPSDWSGPQHVDFVPAGMPLWGYSRGVDQVRTVKLAFDVSQMESLLGEEVDRGRLATPRLCFQDDRIVELGVMLEAACATPRDASGLLGDSLTLAIVVDCLRLTKQAGDGARRARLTPAQLRIAIDIMSSRLAERLRLSEIAHAVGLSQYHFSRAFRAAVGVSPHQWLMRARIARAQRLLRDEDASLGRVSLETGFAEQSHFTRVFKSVVGVSPGSWRRNAHD